MSERNRIEYETELNLQKLDILKANEEMEAIKDFEEEFVSNRLYFQLVFGWERRNLIVFICVISFQKAEEKARIFNDMERSRAETRARKQEQEARDKMDNRLIDVLLKSRAKIEQKRKQTELDASCHTNTYFIIIRS